VSTPPRAARSPLGGRIGGRLSHLRFVAAIAALDAALIGGAALGGAAFDVDALSLGDQYVITVATTVQFAVAAVAATYVHAPEGHVRVEWTVVALLAALLAFDELNLAHEAIKNRIGPRWLELSVEPVTVGVAVAGLAAVAGRVRRWERVLLLGTAAALVGAEIADSLDEILDLDGATGAVLAVLEELGEVGGSAFLMGATAGAIASPRP
jgi:hypothetical protein